mmetsp:Transcript_26557/g.50302  ORF Transcript_26557/g.50302 Transcript_26557/m.50302 type:complete len:246 (+) Transcript_26557:149-886(+)
MISSSRALSIKLTLPQLWLNTGSTAYSFSGSYSSSSIGSGFSSFSRLSRSSIFSLSSRLRLPMPVSLKMLFFLSFTTFWCSSLLLLNFLSVLMLSFMSLSTLSCSVHIFLPLIMLSLTIPDTIFLLMSAAEFRRILSSFSFLRLSSRISFIERSGCNSSAGYGTPWSPSGSSLTGPSSSPCQLSLLLKNFILSSSKRFCFLALATMSRDRRVILICALCDFPGGGAAAGCAACIGTLTLFQFAHF